MRQKGMTRPRTLSYFISNEINKPWGTPVRTSIRNSGAWKGKGWRAD